LNLGQFMSAHLPHRPSIFPIARSLSRPLAAALCLIGLAINCVIVGPAAFHSAFQGRNDFKLFYIGGKLAGSKSLYDQNRVLEAQREAFGDSNRKLMPVRLPFYYAFLSPVARLPYKLALLLWAASNLLAIALFVRLYPIGTRTHLAIACCWSFPLLFSIAIGQDLGFMLLLLSATLHTLHAGKRLLAGLILSLCLIKFNLVLLLPLLFLGKREWRLASGFSIGTAFLLAVSFLGRWDWPQAYAALILDPAVSPSSYLMPNLHSLAANIPGRELVEFLLSLTVIAAVWCIVRRARFDVALAATLLGSILLTRHVYVQDCAILVGSLVTLFECFATPVVRTCSIVLLLPIAYVLIFIQGGVTAAALFLILLIALAVAEGRAGSREAIGARSAV
jgi:Glycosyltransferase family 87